VHSAVLALGVEVRGHSHDEALLGRCGGRGRGGVGISCGDGGGGLGFGIVLHAAHGDVAERSHGSGGVGSRRGARAK